MLIRTSSRTIVGTEKHGEKQKHSNILEHVQKLFEFLFRTDSSFELDDGTVTSDDLI